MLIKEYRIALPMSVEEYRIAQLYMIQKKSREESRGAGSGVEIFINEPYTNGPGGCGQYTRKIYHIGNHLPAWFRAILPKAALQVEEEAWNAYPFTKTRYTCPFVEKFFIEIETKYLSDGGTQDNVFSLSSSELRARIVDFVDVVKDPVSANDYKREEDPRYYISRKTGRGPLIESWRTDYINSSIEKTIMCAYKLCRVEFRYWGTQNKIERFIHDTGLRKTMLRAHRQAWCWQDEWFGLTMSDIRQLELETQKALSEKMSKANEEMMDEEEEGDYQGSSPALNITNSASHNLSPTSEHSINDSPKRSKPQELTLQELRHDGLSEYRAGNRLGWSRSSSKASLHTPGTGSNKGMTEQWCLETIRRDSDSSSDDEFFDCQEDADDDDDDDVEEFIKPISKWSSVEIIPGDDDLSTDSPGIQTDSIFSSSFMQNIKSERSRHLQAMTQHSIDMSLPCSPTLSPSHQTCSTTMLLIVLHGGSLLDPGSDLASKKADIVTLRSTFDSIMRAHYPAMLGHLVIRLVACPPICSDALCILTSLSPYSFDVVSSTTDTSAASVTYDSIPLGALALFATASPDYQEMVTKIISSANHVYHEFLKSDDGIGFCGQVCLVGDCTGSILGYDALCRHHSRHGSQTSIAEEDSPTINYSKNPLISVNNCEKFDSDITDVRRPLRSRSTPEGELCPRESSPSCERGRLLSAPSPRHSSSSSDNVNLARFDFDVIDFFMFGSPLGLVLAYRKVHSDEDKNSPPPRPFCSQVYNLFHPTDPSGSRIEPLLSARFSMLPPINITRYQKFPLGDGQPSHIVEYIQSNYQLFLDNQAPPATPTGSLRRQSEISLQSTVSGMTDSISVATISNITNRWWGSKRIDYALYCPEGLTTFPTNALPHLFHVSYWESSDVVAFILRQFLRNEDMCIQSTDDRDSSVFSPSQPREKWIKKRTSVKLRNVNANHRANDVVLREGVPQMLSARFAYGPLDVVVLSGEKVDIHVMTNPPGGEWVYFGTEITNKYGRIVYTIPEEKQLGYGMYPIKMMVRGDHTWVDFYLTIVPPKTECVVFSIDGSFTASVSVTGRDPKVRAGAVDIVRHWQDLGYLIIYVTGRPDMQHQRVVAWLAHHNFPHGMVSFVDGLSPDPLRHKANYLRSLIQDAGIIIQAAYGSSKDIYVYSSIGLNATQIYIVGKVSKKHHSQAQILSEGYAAHLNDLMTHGRSRPAQGNARMFIRKGCFGLPGLGKEHQRKKSAKRTTSYPVSASQGQPTIITTGSDLGTETVVRSRGTSLRPKVTF
uniref:Eka-PI transferase 1 protein n=1 Tax=Euperipatoides kanangrensis TaxID=488523 RepID=A0A0F7VHP7_9BILA|nr:Eka-PI transferase 1 protein [Euperipatoides kanangrensis]